MRDGAPAVTRSRREIVVLTVGWLLIAWLALRGHLPLTYDEAFNQTAIASHGPAYVVTHYPFANNHVLFTLLQSLTVGPTLLHKNPDRLRVPNLLLVVGLFAVLRAATRGAPRPLAGWLPLAIAGTSPIFATYLFVARGYLLVAVLLLSAVLLRARERCTWAAVACAAAAYTVPTAAFAFPGVLACSLFTHRRVREVLQPAVLTRELLRPSVVFIALVGAAYWPIATEVAAAGHRHQPYPSTSAFLHAAAIGSTGLGELLSSGLPGIGAAVLAAVWLAVAWRQRALLDSEARVTTTALLAASATLAGNLLLPASGVGNLPFLRSVSFVAPLMAVGLVGIATIAWGMPARRGVGAALYGVVLASGLATLYLMAHAVAVGPPTSYPYFAELSPSAFEPALRARQSLRGANLTANWPQEPHCTLFAQSGLGFTCKIVPSFAPAETTCWSGRHAPPPEQRILVERGGRALGILCY